jgi:hypothetical protein
VLFTKNRIGAVTAVLEPHMDREETEDREDMDEGVQKSCWGVTAKAVIGFAGIMMLAWLFGGSEVATVVAGG